MALLDISYVTRSLIKLVDTVVRAWPVAPLSVTAQPPDRLTGVNSIGVYLYHLTEDPQFKSFPPPAGNTEVRFAPMALNLYYLVTAKVENESDDAVLREQLMMGLAVKALRDHPVITETTMVNGVPILDARLAGTETKLRIVLQPIPPHEAASYWAAGSAPPRLAAYYQVSVVLLEPDEAPTLSGRVLQYGVQTFVSGGPRLDSSQSTVAFTPPGGSAKQFVATPAQVPVDGDLVLMGSNLTAGSPSLLVQAAAWSDPVEVDAAWNVSAGQDAVSARVRSLASGQPVLPGMWSAQVKITRAFTLPGGGVRTVAQLSNHTPFTVTPGVGTAIFGGGGLLTVTGTGFAPSNRIDVVVADVKLTVAAVAANPGVGEFGVTSATQILLKLPAGLTAGSFVPLRILVSGAESRPLWVQVP